jgi:prefoldin subunit 5
VNIETNLEDLRAVSQHVLTTTERMHSLELEKRQTPVGSERFLALAEQIEALAGEAREVTAAETDLAITLAGLNDLPTIDEVEARA